MGRRGVALVAVCLTAVVSSAGAVVPDAVPDLPVAGAPVIRGGGLVTSPAADETPAAKTVDGEVSDWTGDITRLAGSAIRSRGEYVYQDHLMDDWGADDGADAERLATTGPIYDAEPRAHRVEALGQAGNEQLDVPAPPAWKINYGDATYPAALRDHADIEEARVAADADELFALVRTTGMTAAAGTAVLVLLDTAPGGSNAAPGGLTTGAETAFVVAGTSCVAGSCPAGLAVDTEPAGHTNALELSLPRASLPDEVGVGIVAGVMSGGSFVPFNVAFRGDEEPAIWMDRSQALALHAGNVDRYVARLDLERLEAGATDGWQPRPGYYERVYVSDSPVNQEMAVEGDYIQGAFQHYGLYLPTTWSPGRRLPAMFWTHYRGGHAHDAAAWVPGLIRQLGEQHDTIVVTPGGRGTNHWYVGRAHEDFLEVWDDVMPAYDIDQDRVYLSGYSMGGYASWLLGMLYPDRWAGAFPTAGPPTQGLWAGAGPAQAPQQGGRVEEQLMFPLIENARHVPYAIFQGMEDELVPYTGVARMASRFTELGYRNRLYSFPAAEHFTLAIIDEWTDAANYLYQFRRNPNPARVTYKIRPALEKAVEEVRTPVTLSYAFDGAYWVDEMTHRDGTAADPNTFGAIDATTYGRGVPQVLGIPEAGAGQQVYPYVMAGLRWLPNGVGAARNHFDADLENLATVRLDLARMGIATGEAITATVTTDGPVTALRLAGDWSAPPAVEGASSASLSGGALTLGFDAAGTYQVTITP